MSEGYIVKAVYENSHPPVWRRIIVPSNISFADFSMILYKAFALSDRRFDYSFPGEYTHINQGKVMKVNKTGLENYIEASKASFNSFLADYSWTRVALSDGRTIRVTLEDLDEEYKERYAVVIKAKDAGIDDKWMKELNGELEKFVIPSRRIKYDSGNRERFMNGFKKLEEVLNLVYRIKTGTASEDDIESLARLREELGVKDALPDDYKIVSDAEDDTGSELKKRTDRTFEFFADIHEGGFDLLVDDSQPKRFFSGDPIEEDNGQLMFPVYTEDEPDRQNDKKSKRTIKRNTIRIRKCDSTSAELVRSVATNHLRNYLRFMDVPNGGSRKEIISRYIKHMKAHPEMICYIFTNKAGKWVRNMCGRGEDLTCESVYFIRETVVILQSLCLVECDVEEQGKYRVLTISYAKDLPRILDSINDKQWKTIDEEVTVKGDRLLNLINIYGMIATEELYCIYNEVFGTEDRSSLQRITYWHMRMLDIIITLTDKTENRHFVAMPDTNVKRLMQYQLSELSPQCTLRHMTKSDWEKLRMGLNAYYCCWNDLAERMMERLSTDELNSAVGELAEAIYGGNGMDDCMYILEQHMPSQVVAERVLNFYLLMEVFMETRIRSLKWNSREEYIHQTGVNPPDLYVSGLFDEGLCGMASEDQMRLYHLWRDAQYHTIAPSVKVDHIEKETVSLLKKYNNDHECYIAAIYILSALEKNGEEISRILPSTKGFSREQKYEVNMLLDKTRKCYNSLYEKARADHYYHERYAVGRDGMEQLKVEEGEAILPPGVWLITEEEMKRAGANTTVKRGSKKIMPNDPCPCGSGKKYKKCCGIR